MIAVIISAGFAFGSSEQFTGWPVGLSA